MKPCFINVWLLCNALQCSAMPCPQLLCFNALIPGTGDVLLSINGIDLTKLSHSEAVATLKASAASPGVLLQALEVQSVEEQGQATQELLSISHENEYDASWSPSWVMWLGLPRYSAPAHSNSETQTPISIQVFMPGRS